VPDHSSGRNFTALRNGGHLLMYLDQNDSIDNKFMGPANGNNNVVGDDFSGHLEELTQTRFAISRKLNNVKKYLKCKKSTSLKYFKRASVFY